MAETFFGTLVPAGGGDRITLTKKVLTVGRATDNDIVLRFSNVSSRHCRLVLSEGYWYVQDLGSSNGVRVNGKKTKDHRVDPHATLTIAKNDYAIDYSPEKLGATGIPPADILDENAITRQSLMQKAGLVRAKRTDETKSTQKDEMDESPSSASHGARASYFEDVPF